MVIPSLDGVQPRPLVGNSKNTSLEKQHNAFNMFVFSQTVYIYAETLTGNVKFLKDVLNMSFSKSFMLTRQLSEIPYAACRDWGKNPS